MDLIKRRASQLGLDDIHEKVVRQERLALEDGVRLYECPDLSLVGMLANVVRERKNGNRCYYVRNQHLNYTNVCSNQCRFCSFSFPPGDERGQTMSVEQVRERVAACLDHEVSEIHVVGGINPDLDCDYYLGLIRAVKETRPGVHLKAFTMIELAQIARKAGKPLGETLAELKAAGLDSIPGGGAEVFSNRVHEELFPDKQRADEWLDVARAAHRAGLPSNATMLYGHIETVEEKVQHLLRLRELQDETGGFLAYLPLHFCPAKTELAGKVEEATGEQDLREIALGRLMLDNFEHIKSFWVMISPPVAQIAQWYGTDDIDGTVVEYEITRDPVHDTKQRLTHRQLVHLIEEAGREPFERDAKYEHVAYEEPAASTAATRVGPEPNGTSSATWLRYRGDKQPCLSAPHRDLWARKLGSPEVEDAVGRILRTCGHDGRRSAPREATCGAEPLSLDDLAHKVPSGERLTFEDAMRLWRHPNLVELGALADLVRVQRHPDPMVTYVTGRNINYTNVCSVRCAFCAFSRSKRDEDAFVLPKEEILRKVEEMVAAGGIEILMQGGLNPELRIDYFEDLFRSIIDQYPHVILHALSPTEIRFIARISGLSVPDTLRRLRESGLHSIPGGGAELLVDEIRESISPRKGRAEEWLEVMREAHRQGIPSTATMMYGAIESLEQRTEHLLRIRELQDETGGLTAFIPWSFQPNGSPLGEELKARPDWQPATACDYLRTVAISRVVLDNIDNLQASWVTQGIKVAQVSLRYGVNDFGSTMMEENVVRAAGTQFEVQVREIERNIRAAGYEPRKRNTRYELQD